MTEMASVREVECCAPPTSGGFRRGLDEFLLLREMHHRFANTLTALGGVLRCHLARPAADFRRSLERFETQVVAFGNLHRCLMVGASNDRISVRSYFMNLCKALSDAVLEPRGIGYELSADSGELQSERCELLGLVIAELVTNAAKHAFCEYSNGLVRIELMRKGDIWLCRVIDNGTGLGAASPGLGSSIVGQLVQTLGGHLSTNSGKTGTSVVVMCPVGDASAAQDNMCSRQSSG
jgi:two-component sensor histidine kinase